MRDGATGPSVDGKPGGLCKLCQLDVVGAVGALHDQVHAARLEIHLDIGAEYGSECGTERLAAYKSRIRFTCRAKWPSVMKAATARCASVDAPEFRCRFARVQAATRASGATR